MNVNNITNTTDNVKRQFGGDLVTAVYEFVGGFPLQEITIGFDTSFENQFIEYLVKVIQQGQISIITFNLSNPDVLEKYFDYLSYQTEQFLGASSLFFGRHRLYELLLIEINERNLIRRNTIFIFYWGRGTFSPFFTENIPYSMKVYAITFPRNNTFRLYYSQVTSNKEHDLEMINWWHQDVGIFHHPTLPITKSVYLDFKGRVLQVPVLHKPPWHFVRHIESKNSSSNESYLENEIEVLGGRDDRILKLLANKLNFRFNYFDPHEKLQETLETENGYVKGVIGLISTRKADLFIGDVELTFERFKYVEFSFITLADSGAFVTHAPRRLNEALALLRPFQWKVWPAIGITVIAVGPILYLLIALPNQWRPRFRVESYPRLFFDCTWFTITILLKQTGREPKSNNRTRFFIILLSISATYVISDMYSANLTSLLARPGREKAIHDLYQLEEAMISRDYKLFIEKHSSSYGLLENGTGIYSRLYDLMIIKQGYNNILVDSVEAGVKLVRESKNVAVMGGRETLFFDIQRFGSSNFHLSGKLNTAYSAIALQLGCPYIEEINKILMTIFEAGIITKMTENEYEKLGKGKDISSSEIAENVAKDTNKDLKRQIKAEEENERLKPISLKMLQGAFYLLCFGNVFSGIILIGELIFYKRRRNTCQESI
ncbi:ionotropic receptor 40a [Diorhabda sublineata]|uniref:ionotropic receptor 40a n=1 Tax=Diorhabda sublineata TaxID=1163346 RepID=UPI0024E0F71B|nr:ionotropic receptor 40a [Diorhabda sublineata]